MFKNGWYISYRSREYSSDSIVWLIYLTYSRCPEGFGLQRYSNSEADVSCFNLSSSELQMSQTSDNCVKKGGKWIHIELENESGYELAIENGTALIAYFGNDSIARQFKFNKNYTFELSWKLYCVSTS